MRNFLLVIFFFACTRSMASVHADFSADKFSGCPPLLVNFYNTSLPNNLSLQWTFGNGNSSVNLATPSALFQTSGTYFVKLVVSNGTESDSITKTVTVFSLPVVDFHAPYTALCEGDTVQLFSDITIGDASITDYAWDLGNGVAKSGMNTRYLYNQPGQYDITLVVQDSNMCSANVTKSAFIEVLAKPNALFTASPATSCNYSQLVSFTNSSTGIGLSYDWQLDSSTHSALQNPQHLYTQEIVNVMLTVTSSDGCVDSVKHKVTVASLSSDFLASKTDACTGETINFSNASNFIGNCSWDFGDGTSANAPSPGKTYTAPGIYTVRMINIVGGACKDTVIKTSYITIRQGVIPSFTVNVPSTGCADTAVVTFTNTTVGTGLSYQWTFGDGDSSAVANPTHVYNHNGNFNVALTVTDASGCSIPVIMPASISSHMPVARFKADTLGCPGGPVHFHNQSSGATTYLWSFGDGTTSTDVSPLHTYTTDGTYSVTLTSTNGQGCDSTIIKANYVHIVSPQVDFAVNQTYSPCPPFVAIFHSTADRLGMKYFWDFGDGNTDTSANPTHIFFHPGIYTVKLIGTTNNGCTDTISYQNLIDVEGPTGNFTTSSTGGCLPLTVDFSANISANTASIWCDLGDGTLITDSTHLNYLYTRADSFNPKFILVDNVGCAVSYSLPAVVTHPTPVVTLPDTTVCHGSILAIALGADNYEWTPPTYLSCHVCSAVQISPDDNITYRVSASNSFGCSAMDTMRVHVEKLAEVLDNPDTVLVCKNTSFTLNAGSADKMYWTPGDYLSDSASIHPVCTPLTSTTYYVTGQSNIGCRKSTKVEVIVIDKLQLNEMADIAICPQDTFQFSASIVTTPQLAIVNYTWTPANLLSAANIPNPSGHYPPVATTFRVIASAGTCASDTALVTVHLNSTPDITVPEDLITTPNADVKLKATSSFNMSYQWQASDSFSCAACKETSIYPTQSQTVYVTGTTSAGCIVNDSLHIRVVSCDPEMIFLANTFTPNGDGVNDKFYIHSLALSQLKYFRVFDEWGRMVYETESMNDGWDGSVNGTAAGSAVYTYLMAGKCQNGYDIEKSGNIALMR